MGSVTRFAEQRPREKKRTKLSYAKKIPDESLRIMGGGEGLNKNQMKWKKARKKKKK